MLDSCAPSTFATLHQPEYDHTQRSPFYLVLVVPGLLGVGLAATLPHKPEALLPTLFASLALVGSGYSFRSLRVVDERDRLAIRFGPLPLFRKRIRYADIQNAERDRTSIVDGWGIHWIAGRGWTYNLWGFQCVRLTTVGGRTIRIGTDDPDGLEQFLKGKIAAHKR